MEHILNWGKYPNFTEDECKCTCGACGGMAEMDADFMAKLQRLRTHINRPIQITSGYRCVNHPIESAKKSPGTHTMGKAVDIAVSDGQHAHEIIAYASTVFTGIGVSRKSGGGFIHLDTATVQDGKARPNMWSY